MIDLLEKLMSEDFEDTFKPASEEDINQRLDDMKELYLELIGQEN